MNLNRHNAIKTKENWSNNYNWKLQNEKNTYVHKFLYAEMNSK